MRKLLAAIAIMAGVVGLAYGGPLITGGGGGSSGSVTGATISGVLTADQVVVGAGTNSLKDGGAGLFATTSSLAGYSTTAHNHTGVYATASSNVATATALAADPADCPAGQYPLGITAAGSAWGCTTAGTGGGDVSLSGTLALNNVVMAAGTNSVKDSGIAYGVLATATSLTGYSTTAHNHTGVYATASSNVATATALAANGANCSAGWFPLGVDASGAAETCTQATGVFATLSSVIGSSASGQFLYNQNGVVSGLTGFTTDGTNINLPGQLVVSSPTQTGGNGMMVLVTAASTVAAGNVVYPASTGILYPNASTTANMHPFPLLMVDSCNKDQTNCRALKYGFYRYPTTQSWTVGATLYLSTTDGSLMTTIPSVAGRGLQIIGYAADSITVWFQPSPTIVGL